MKRLLSIACLLSSGLGAGAVAQAAPAKPATTAPVAITGATKIAIINFQQAVGQSNEFQRDIAQLRDKYQGREQSLQQLNQQIEALKKQLQTSGATLSEANRQAQLREIDDKTKSLQRSAEDLRNDEQTDTQEKFQEVGQKVFNEVGQFAQKEGFQLVLDSSQQTSGVVFATPGTDITAAVVKAYNAKSGIAAPAPGVPSAPAPHAGASSH